MTVANSLLGEIAGEETEHLPADQGVRQIKHEQRHRKRDRQTPVARPPEGRQHHRRQELRQCCHSQQDAGPDRTPAHRNQQCESQQAGSGAIDMRVAGELPDRQRQPRIDQQFRRITAGHAQQQDKRDDRERVERRDHQLHAEHAGRHRRGHCEDRLRRGRIHGVRIVAAIDVRIDRVIAQEREFIGGRQVAVRIDTGKLHAAIPYIAVDVRRKHRWRDQRQQPHRHGDAEHQPEAPWRQTTAANDRDGKQP